MSQYSKVDRDHHIIYTPNLYEKDLVKDLAQQHTTQQVSNFE